ncbi:MAG: histidine kinase, partial [Myxococcales bacterium]|nr:histidine kinase [Myxococcales bacterium]
AGLAHEIRNPLNGAKLHLTFLERALRAPPDGEVIAELRDAVGVVSDEIDRLGRLVTEFLDFARPRGLKREHVTLQDICTRAADLIAPALAEVGVTLVMELPQAPLSASVDSGMIQQVLLNLLSNALQATKEGGRVVLRCYRRPFTGVIEVEDDGPGLADPTAPIFDAFYSTKDGGTGLGLSIVHRIVTDHGGDVTVQSVPGETIFQVELPLEDPEAPPSTSLPPTIMEGS